MLIRHYTVPKASKLMALAEPSTADNFDQPPQLPSYFARTLQPELPIQQTLIPPPPQGRQLPLSPSRMQTNHRTGARLAEQVPHSLNTIQSPKYNTAEPQEEVVAFTKQRMTTFAPSTPPRRHRNPLNIPTLSNNAYLAPQPVQQQQQDIIQRHVYLQDHKSALYRTIEKHRAKQKLTHYHSAIDTPLPPHKKYTLSLPKHDMTAINYRREEPLQLPHQPPRTNSRRLSAKRPKGLSQPTLLTKHKLPPNDPEEAGLLNLLSKHKNTTQISVKKTSQEEQRLAPKQQSQIEIIRSEKRSALRAQPKIDISFRTPLGRLRQICSMSDLQSDKLLLRVPEVFAYPLFSQADSQQQLFSKGRDLLSQLGVSSSGSQLSIRRYSNCVVLTRGQLGIVWHFTGRVYLGGWKQSNVGTGCKQGLGLEWSPNKYYYYGQFNRNKREGIGLMKSSNKDILAGYWRQNKLMAGCRGQDSPIAWLRQ